MRPQRKHAVYSFYDADDNLLYIGISVSVAYRIGSHRTSKLWWDDVATIRVEHVQSRDDALDRELYRIRTENPRHNMAGRVGPIVEPVEEDGELPEYVGGVECYARSQEVLRALDLDEGWLADARAEGLPHIVFSGAGFRYKITEVEAWRKRVGL